jgi:hypothetical protein
MARPTELTVTYSRKNKTGDYESEDVFLAEKFELEKGDDSDLVARESFARITKTVDAWSANGSHVLTRAHLSSGATSPQPPAQPAGQEKPVPTTGGSPERGAEAAPEENKKTYDYHAMRKVASIPSMNKLDGILNDAIAKVSKTTGKSANDAREIVKTDLLAAFQREWGESLNYPNWHGNNQGQVSWSIDYLKRTYALEGLSP